MVSTRVWLGLVSISSPSVRGWSDSAGKVLDGLRLAVFEDLEIVFLQAGNQQSVLVFHIKEDIDDVDLGLKNLHPTPRPPAPASSCGGTVDCGGSWSCTVNCAISGAAGNNNITANTK